MHNVSASAIIKVTKPFVAARVLVYLAVTLIMLVVGILGALLCIWSATVSGALSFILFLAIFFGLVGFLRFAKRYALYMVKAAHIAAITEYLKTGNVPVTEKGYKSVLAFGAEKIKSNFVSANVAFAADALISGATRQIMRWVNRIENLFSFIPGARSIFAFINLVLSTALNYIDEAVLSYVFWHTEEKSGLKKACDGLVYYAQSWKSMLKGALKVGVTIWLLRIVSYLVFFFIFNTIGAVLFSASGFFFALLIAFVVLYGIETALVDPYATCIMIIDYHKAIKDQPLKADLYGKLCSVSRKFRDLFSKSGQPNPAGDPTFEGAAAGQGYGGAPAGPQYAQTAAGPAYAGATAGPGYPGQAYSGQAQTGPTYPGQAPHAYGATANEADGAAAQRFCSNCGNRGAAGMSFCSICGASM